MTARDPHPTHWTAVVEGGALMPGQHAALRPTQGEAQAFVDLHRRGAEEINAPFAARVIPPRGAA